MSPTPDSLEATLREVVETLAVIDRPPCSPGERQAAEWLAARLRAGYPIVTLVSMTDWRSPANYHLPSDVPANLDFNTVADDTRLVYELARSLADAETDEKHRGRTTELQKFGAIWSNLD